MIYIDPGGGGEGTSGGRPKFELAIDDRVARITLNSPPLNVLTLAMIREILSRSSPVSREEAVCAIVVRVGPEMRAFSAGLAIDEHRSEIAYQMLEAFHGIFRDLNFYSKPTIAVVTDAALGGGMRARRVLRLRDRRRASRASDCPRSRRASFRRSPRTILPRLIGLRRAKHLILTGALLSAREALDYGLVTYVVPDDQVPAKLAELTGALRRLSAPGPRGRPPRHHRLTGSALGRGTDARREPLPQPAHGASGPRRGPRGVRRKARARLEAQVTDVAQLLRAIIWRAATSSSRTGRSSSALAAPAAAR